MDAATQDLVDRALREVATFEVSRPGSAQIIRAALEAAQRPQVSPEVRDRIERIAAALLARWSFPAQPVYDEEAIARWLTHEELDILEPREFAAALVAALPSLTVDVKRGRLVHGHGPEETCGECLL